MQDNQENMSVEEILSSIKNVLEDESDIKTEQVVEEQEENVVDVDFEDDAENGDDIIELSEDFILNDANVFDDADDNSFNLEESVEEIKPDPDFNVDEFINSLDNVIKDSNNLGDDFVEEETPESITSVVEEEEHIEEVVPVDENIEPQEAEIFEEVEEDVVEEVEDASLASDNNEITLGEKEKTSVEIINNFAKMFSATPVVVDDVVLEDVLQKEIAKKVMDINFDNIANAQIKKWLNDNLSLVVEKVVKEKLEEVLAKNGQ